MKKRILSLAAALIALCAVTIFASAEEADPGVTVQLDGQTLEFTDAKPQVKDERTFLPFRAVFEALGAEVGNEGNVVTATRGDTTLTMTIGETTATVTRGGVAEELTMNVAPYVDSTTWRTYVPVRFAADAFGCNVGWDQAAMTAIIVDVDKLVDETLAGKEFTWLQKLMAYAQKYNTGNWAMDGAMNASASFLGTEPAPLLTGTVSGISAGSTAAQASVAMDMDMTGIMESIAAMAGGTLEDMGVSAEELRMSMAMDMKMDLASGVMYMKLDDVMAAEMGLEPNTWMSMDLNAILADSGMEWDYNAMMAMASQIDMVQVLKALLAEISLDGQSATGYLTLSTAFSGIVNALSDDGFQQTEDGYATTLALAAEGVELAVALSLGTDDAGEVNSYAMGMDLLIPFDEATQAEMAQLAAMGITVDGVAMSVQAALDQDDHMVVEMDMSMGTLLSLIMDMAVDYTATTEAPDTALPEGAVVVDYMDLM